jgi:hypothetical protein
MSSASVAKQSPEGTGTYQNCLARRGIAPLLGMTCPSVSSPWVTEGRPKSDKLLAFAVCSPLAPRSAVFKKKSPAYNSLDFDL